MLKKNLFSTFLGALFALSATSSAVLAQEQPRAFSLVEAESFALDNNLARKNALLDVDISRKKVWETTAQGLPQVSAGVDFQYILNDLPTLSFPGPSGDPVEVEVGEKANATYSITMTQLVFNGPYIVGLQAAKAYRKMAENALAKTDRDLKAQVASSYLTVLLLEQTRSILDSSVANTRQLLSETMAMQQGGFADNVAVDRLKVTLSMVENSLAETSKQLESAYRLLKIQMGLPLEDSIRLTDNLIRLVEGYSPQGALAGFDPGCNIDLQILSNQVEVNRLKLKLQKSNFLPSISAFLSFKRLHKEPQINFAPTALLGAKLTFPIFSSGMRWSKVQQARIELEKANNTYRQTLQSIEMDYADARAGFTVAWGKYHSQKENMILARKVLDNVRTRYRNGVASQLDIIQANDKYLQAVGNYMGAIVQLINARIRIDKISGKL